MGTNITFTEQAFEEYLSWQGQDRKTLKKINALLKDICRSPFEGIGKPEPLKVNKELLEPTSLCVSKAVFYL